MDPLPPPYSPEALGLLRRKAKIALRARLRGLRAQLPPSARAARSARITDAVLALDGWQRATTVALFRSMHDEVDTDALLHAAIASGKRVALPVTPDHSAPLRFRLASAPGFACVYEHGPMGILEPSAEAPELRHEDLDFMLVPCLGIDPSGHRLGFGRGHYDHTIPLCPRALRVAVAFDFQLIAEVPAEDHDARVDVIVTDAQRISLLTTENPPR